MQQKGAVFSECRTYRYSLWRIWNDLQDPVLFIGLNPSTADEYTDDPTIRRCIGFANSWGHGGIIMANLFGFRATEPKDMMKADDPVGPDNDWRLKELAERADIAVAAWGNGGSFRDRGKTVAELVPDLFYLKLNKSGQPAHPLYLKADLQPQYGLWQAPAPDPEGAEMAGAEG